MSPKSISAAIVRRRPELKELTPRQLRVVRSAIEEAVALSTKELLSPEETKAEFRKWVPDSEQPSAALRAYRAREGLTQRALAERSGIPQPHIAAMESGKRSIGLTAAKKLALALGVNFRKLV